MSKKRHKLRLRKQVIIALPIILLLSILTISVALNKKGNLSNEVSQTNVLASNKEIKDTSTMNLSDLPFFKSLEEGIELRQKDNTVIYYANIFKLDVDKTLELAHKYTNNYTDAEFNTNFKIGPAKVKNKLNNFTCFEAGVVYFVRDLYRYPEKYGSSIAEIRTSESPTSKPVSSDGNIYMNNGLTFEQYVAKISKLYNVDETLVLAISYHEAGVKTSNLFRSKNNIGGHRGYNGWMSYTTLEAGIIAHVLSVKSIAERSGLDISEVTPDEVAAISGIYVNGTASKPAASWIEKVVYFMDKIEKEDLFKTNE